MKITGTKSYILIEYDHRILKIKGELTMSGFYASLHSIVNWEPPYENTKVTKIEKGIIIEKIKEENAKNDSFKIFFDE